MLKDTTNTFVSPDEYYITLIMTIADSKRNSAITIISEIAKKIIVTIYHMLSTGEV